MHLIFAVLLHLQTMQGFSDYKCFHSFPIYGGPQQQERLIVSEATKHKSVVCVAMEFSCKLFRSTTTSRLEAKGPGAIVVKLAQSHSHTMSQPIHSL